MCQTHMPASACAGCLQGDPRPSLQWPQSHAESSFSFHEMARTIRYWAWSRSSHPSSESQGLRPAAGVILGPRMGGTLSIQGTHSTKGTLGTPKVPQKHKLNQIN
jgi:hypothetical protein